MNTMFIQLLIFLTLCINLTTVTSASPFTPSPTSNNNNNYISMSSFTTSTLPGGCPFNLKTANKKSLLNSYDDFVSTSSKFLSIHGGSSTNSCRYIRRLMCYVVVAKYCRVCCRVVVVVLLCFVSCQVCFIIEKTQKCKI